VIYAIRALGTNLIKFGKAKSPESRIAILQTGCPVDLALIAVADWPDSEDFKLHIFLSEDHARGEWFKDGNRAKKALDCMRDIKHGLERWHQLKRKYSVHSIREPLVIKPITQIAPKSNHRLGRAIEYANQLTGNPAVSTANPAGATQALQPYQGSS
jgi:hypothetical protein